MVDLINTFLKLTHNSVFSLYTIFCVDEISMEFKPGSTVAHE
jgi:hypothetical protein